MKKTIPRMLMVLLVALFIANASMVCADDLLDNYENVSAVRVIDDINRVVNSYSDEGEIRYDTNYTTYRLTVSPKEVNIGGSVTATAETNNRMVTRVTFIWVNPRGLRIRIQTVDVVSNNGWKTAQDTYNPNVLGTWYVFALFIGQGKCLPRCYAMRWTCFKVKSPQVIPDFPVVGTAGAMTAMLLGLGLFLNKKRQSPI